MPALNAIAWFEVATDNPAEAERFYGDVFGWQVAHDDTKSTDSAYQIFSTGSLSGGLFDTKGEMAGYAVFGVLVEDVEATCRRVEEAGGKVQRAPHTNPAGVTFAHLLDPAGNHFSVFRTPVS
ncbi:VOC family protein [Amycolatopsis acidicola]|uniref:VOC family protein n=1 Tax=Amycolatopsis acidicola TaxID=2596893 RepID=A0A5N0UYX2_9PSEU|nr:VOC family protein [Amycolatopsis acidicola]KAA9156689.1 VOC family protein [Amycolatopsis acidicola]